MNPNIVQLDQEEEVVGIVRRSFLAEFPRFVFALVWLLLPFFFLFPLLQLGMFGVVFMAVLLFSGLYYAVRQWVTWRYTMLLITDRRVIDVDQLGVFERTVSELDLEVITDVVHAPQGIIRRLFRIGAVRVETTKAHLFDLEISDVKRPKQVCELILDVQYMVSEGTDAKKRYVKKGEVD